MGRRTKEKCTEESNNSVQEKRKNVHGTKEFYRDDI